MIKSYIKECVKAEIEFLKSSANDPELFNEVLDRMSNRYKDFNFGTKEDFAIYILNHGVDNIYIKKIPLKQIVILDLLKERSNKYYEQAKIEAEKQFDIQKVFDNAKNRIKFTIGKNNSKIYKKSKIM